MAQDLDAYSRVVGWLKLFLPLGGLAILSTLFLFARGERYPDNELTASDLAPTGTAETVLNPDYSGVTGDGTLVTFSASSAWPHANDKVEAAEVSARFVLPDGSRAEVRAEEGVLDGSVLTLTGDVEVDVLPDWKTHTDRMYVWLDATRLEADVDVRTTGPIGSIEADTMLITRDEGADEEAYLVEYVGDVHLVYKP